MIKNVLMICTGNACRSVMAEYLLREMLKKEGIDNILVSSAGIMQGINWGPVPNTIEIMKREGIDVSGYKSRRITEKLVKSANIILGMTEQHRQYMLSVLPCLKDRVKLLREFDIYAKGYIEIADPARKDMAFFGECIKVVKRSLLGFMEWLKKENNRDEKINQ